jgi:RNA recognition motif-containing protein
MKLFVASLPWAATNQDLVNHFSQEGNVMDAKIIMDHATNKSKGFGFVTMENADAGSRAIREFDGQSFMGRKIVVREAEEPKRS